MKTSSLWIIRLALTVQFAGVLAVPTLLAAAESPRAMWMAEWINPIQGLGDGKLSFVEQIGQVDWELDLASVTRVAAKGWTISILSVTGEEFILSIIEADLTHASPKKAIALIERAAQSLATSSS